MIFRVPTDKISFIPDKATLKVDKLPWEILWRSRQGALMGAHPDTDGYRTLPQGGFEFADRLPEMPDWLYRKIADVYPSSRYRRPITKPTNIVTQSINLRYEEGTPYELERAIEEAQNYLLHISSERADDYDEWIAVGMALHQISDSLLEDWVLWSCQSESFEDGCCEEKWDTFERMPGGPAADNARGLRTLRAKAKEDGYIDLGGFVVPTLDTVEREIMAEHADMLNESMNYDDISPTDMQLGLTSFLNDVSNTGADPNKKAKNPPSSFIAMQAVPFCMEQGWKYDPRFDVFMRYNESRGIWKKEEYRNEFRQHIQMLLDNALAAVLPKGYTANLLQDVCTLLQGHLVHYDWNDDSHLLAFRNGVLEIISGEFLEHSRDNYITWGLDFDYDPHADPGPIVSWLQRTQYDDNDRVQVLRAWLRSCLAGRGNEIQRFLEVIGPGGRGKSTFANLCCAFVGAGNYASTTLTQLEQSRFELAAIKDKRLTLINDSERYGGSAQTFKALTGGDSLRYEEKLKAIGEPFVYTGMVMVAANEPIQTTDNTSGLSRRRLTIEFNRSLYSKGSEARDMIKIDRGVVSGLWKDYLPGLVNWVLEMSESEMRRYLLDTDEMVPSLKKVRNHILLNSNNLIEWLQSEVVVAEGHLSAVGKKIPAPKDSNERYYNSKSHLYPSYCEHCESTGSKAVGQKRFINLLLDCCRNQLGIKDVITFSKSGKTFFKGLAVRASDHKFDDYPTILEERN